MPRARRMRRTTVAAACFVAVLSLSACGERSKEGVQPARGASADVERWYGVYMQGAKVGHSSTRERLLEENGEKLVETTTTGVIASRRGSDVVRMQIASTSVETPEGDLRRFSRSIDMGAGPQTANGTVADGQLTIEDLAGGNRQLAWRSECRGFHAWEKILARDPPPPGEVRSFRALDDQYLAILPQELVGGAEEETKTPGGAKRLRRMEHRVALADGQQQVTQIWIDRRGVCVKLRSDAMGIEFHLMSRDEALAPPEREINLLYDTMASLAAPLLDARRTQWVRYRIGVERGDASRLVAACPMQAVRKIDEQTAEVVVRRIAPGVDLAAKTAGASFPAERQPPDAASRASNHYITSDDPAVAAMAKEVSGDDGDAWRLAVALERLVHERMVQFDYSKAFLTAAEVARERKGDCSEHAVLLAAVLRARGIPSRVAVGLVYVDSAAAMGYHMWTEAWIDGRWVGLDATLGDGGIAADHIKIAATDLEHGLADPALATLMQLLGAKPRIEVVEAQRRAR